MLQKVERAKGAGLLVRNLERKNENGRMTDMQRVHKEREKKKGKLMNKQGNMNEFCNRRLKMNENI